MKKKYDVAVMFANDKVVFEYIDTFVYENIVYSVMGMVGTKDVMIFEELELRGRKIGKGLNDTCFIPVDDPIIQAAATERLMNKEITSSRGNQVSFTGLRSLDEYEKKIGRSIKENELFYHDKVELD